jgi:ribosome-associated protein
MLNGFSGFCGAAFSLQKNIVFYNVAQGFRVQGLRVRRKGHPEATTMNWNIIDSELKFRTSRSSGAGGQHVNKTETRVEAILDIPESEGLSDEEKERILLRLSNRINDNGQLVVVSSKSRSQLSNKTFAIEQIKILLEKALLREKKRKKTTMPDEVKEERFQEKRRHAEKKELRRKPEI